MKHKTTPVPKAVGAAGTDGVVLAAAGAPKAAVAAELDAPDPTNVQKQARAISVEWGYVVAGRQDGYGDT